MSPYEELTREATRLHQRYHREFVEKFSFCPWARLARESRHTRVHVSANGHCDPMELEPILHQWSTDEEVEVGFVISPRYEGTAAEFAEWTDAIGALVRGSFIVAPFFSLSPEEGANNPVQFLRQSPDPTVQLVRSSKLQEVRAQDPPHYADIFELNATDLTAATPTLTVAASVFEHNKRVLQKEGRALLQSILDDIRADRERTYAAIFPRLPGHE